MNFESWLTVYIQSQRIIFFFFLNLDRTMCLIENVMQITCMHDKNMRQEIFDHQIDTE